MKAKEIKEKIPKIGIRIVLIIVAIILMVFAIGALFLTGVFQNEYTNSLEKVSYQFDNIFVNILFVAIALAIIYGLAKWLKKIKPKYILIGGIILYVILSVVWILFSKTLLKADQKIVEEVARKLIEGDTVYFAHGQYMDYHPLQISIVLFIEMIYRITGQTNPIIIKFLNVLFNVVTILYLYKITNLLFHKEKTQKIESLLVVGCFILVLWTTFVYGNIVGLMLGVMAIFYTLKYLENKKPQYLIIMAVTILLAVIIKSNYQIYMIGIIITLLLELFKKIDFKIIATIFSILVLFLVSNKGIVALMELRLEHEISDGIPMISYIEMGLSKPYDRSSGWYNAKVDVEKIYRENDFDSKKASKASKESLIQRFAEMKQEPLETLKFFADKVASTWIEPTYQSIWINEPAEFVRDDPEYFMNNKILISIYQGKINKILVKYLDIYQIIVFTFSGIYIILNRKKMTNKEACMLIIFFGGVLFHIIWETKSLYAIPFYILLLPYCAAGLEQTFTKVEEKIKKYQAEKRNKSEEVEGE